jgi:hypothetical protein
MSTVARRVLITVIVLVLLLIAADRIGAYVAERMAADKLQSSQHLDSRPDVSIAGFPFLTQLAAGDFDKITVTATDLPVGNNPRQLLVSRLKVVLHRLTVSRSFSRVHADTADATATITYAELGHTLGLPVTYAGDGRIRAGKSVTVAGRTLSASVSARPELVNGALSFAAARVNGAGQLGEAVTSTLTRVFDLTIPLQGLPFKVRVKSLQVTRGRILIALTGSDLSYAQS